MQTSAATVENSVELLQKIKHGAALWLSNSTSGTISKEIWNTESKECVHPSVHCSGVYNSQALEAAQVSISRWVDKNNYTYTVAYYLTMKKKEMLPFTTAWVDLEGIIVK